MKLNLPKTFFATKWQLSGIHQVTKIFPTGGDFINTFLQFNGNPKNFKNCYLITMKWIECKIPINSSASRHASGESPDSRFTEVRNTLHIVGDDCQRVGRSNEKGFLTQNHVSILSFLNALNTLNFGIDFIIMNYPVTIKSGSKSEITFFHGLYQVGGVCKIRIRMMSPEIFQGNDIHYTLCASSQFFAKYAADIWTSHCQIKSSAKWFWQFFKTGKYYLHALNWSTLSEEFGQFQK